MSRLANEQILTQLLLLLVGVALLLVTFQHQSGGLPVALSPVFFPRIILCLWIVLASVALFQDIARPSKSPPIGLLLSALAYIIATVIYVNLVTRLGFGLSSIPFAAVALWIFGLRNPLVIGAYALIVPAALVVLFNHISKMPLPTSPLTYLF